MSTDFNFDSQFLSSFSTISQLPFLLTEEQEFQQELPTQENMESQHKGANSLLGEDLSNWKTSQALQQPNEYKEKTSSESQTSNYVDITELLVLSQRKAAAKLGIPSSTMNKRWKEATVNRKWPNKELNRIDKHIQALVAEGSVRDSGTSQKTIDELMQQRKHLSRKVVIRIVKNVRNM